MTGKDLILLERKLQVLLIDLCFMVCYMLEVTDNKDLTLFLFKFIELPAHHPHIFIHHPFEKWNTRKQEEKLVIIEANLPIAVLYSSQILFAHLSINMLLLSTMLNGIHL